MPDGLLVRTFSLSPRGDPFGVGCDADGAFVGPVPRVRAAMTALESVVSTYEWLHPYVDAYRVPPKTLEELEQAAQDAAGKTPTGYDRHHIVEQTAARADGFSDSQINGKDNVVLISKLKHWLINGWFQTPNKKYGGLSPREYLQGKSWEERRRVGLEALTLFGVLKR